MKNKYIKNKMMYLEIMYGGQNKYSDKVNEFGKYCTHNKSNVDVNKIIENLVNQNNFFEDLIEFILNGNKEIVKSTHNLDQPKNLIIYFGDTFENKSVKEIIDEQFKIVAQMNKINKKNYTSYKKYDILDFLFSNDDSNNVVNFNFDNFLQNNFGVDNTCNQLIYKYVLFGEISKKEFIKEKLIDNLKGRIDEIANIIHKKHLREIIIDTKTIDKNNEDFYKKLINKLCEKYSSDYIYFVFDDPKNIFITSNDIDNIYKINVNFYKMSDDLFDIYFHNTLKKIWDKNGLIMEYIKRNEEDQKQKDIEEYKKKKELYEKVCINKGSIKKECDKFGPRHVAENSELYWLCSYIKLNDCYKNGRGVVIGLGQNTKKYIENNNIVFVSDSGDSQSLKKSGTLITANFTDCIGIAAVFYEKNNPKKIGKVVLEHYHPSQANYSEFASNFGKKENESYNIYYEFLLVSDTQYYMNDFCSIKFLFTYRKNEQIPLIYRESEPMEQIGPVPDLPVKISDNEYIRKIHLYCHGTGPIFTVKFEKKDGDEEDTVKIEVI
jgi:hypothetical protein